jgi:hypothetical protein
MSTAEVVTTGLLLVFGLLILITGVLYLLPLLLNLPARLVRKKKTMVPAAESVPAKADDSHIPGEILAAIMAAITAEEEGQGVSACNFRVVSFKKIGRK